MTYTYSHLEDYIRKVFQRLNIYSPNQLNLYTIADGLNIGVYPINDKSQALRFDNRDYIFLNKDLTGPERFEVFGHELGHLLIHVGNQTAMPLDFQEYQEWQANSFALHFCIPTFMLQQSLRKLKNSNEAVREVSEAYNVTPEFAHKRLEIHHQKLLQISLTYFQLVPSR